MNSDRGALQRQFDFAREDDRSPLRGITPTGVDRSGVSSISQPWTCLSADALMELVVAPDEPRPAWRQVKRNRGAPGPDGMTIKQFEALGP